VFALVFALAFERVQLIHVDTGFISEQQYQNSQTNSGLCSSDRQNKEHKNLTVHVTQVVRKRYEVGIYSKQHQLNRHQQDNQIFTVQKDANDGQCKKHRSKYQKMP
jgi:hypothetical protein